ncbi:hypothetical protein SUDANB120_01912 [Streptomyces sp. enrichment culture]|uniref:DUF4190 domain-containing protein n=1 Tax=Streptomyces sp. enrichment culture TaxID=1795815 RepID=UPI003F54604B
MSTPPNPPGTPSEPEHEGTPVHRPEAEPTPAPAAKPSLRKTPEPGAGAPQPAAPTEPAGPSLSKEPAPVEAPAPEAAAPAAPSLRKEPAPAETAAPEPADPALGQEPAAAAAAAPEAAAPGEPAGPSLRKEPAPAEAPAPEAAAPAAPSLRRETAAPEPVSAEAPAPEADAAAEPSPAPAAHPAAAAEAAVASAGFASPGPGAALAADAPPAAAAPGRTPPVGPAPGAYAAPGMPGGAQLPPGPPPAYPGAPVPPPAGNPWAYHGAGGTWGAPVQESNGLAVASLVLGACAIFFGPVPLLFWGGGILGLIAIGTGLGGIKRASAGLGRKAMAVAGAALGILGLLCSVGGYFLTERLVDSARHGIEREIDSWPEPDTDGLEIDPEEFGSDDPWPAHPGRPTPAPSPSRSDVPGMTSPLPFGETFAYPDGIKVSLSQPKPYKTKNRYADIGNAVQMTLTITNDSAKNHNVIYAVPNVRDDKGMTAKLVFDGDVPKLIRGDILPGQSASGVVVFEVPEGTTSLSADISPGTLMQSVKFSGKIG